MKEKKNKIQSVLLMKNLYFEKILFNRGEALPTEIKTGFKTDYEITEKFTKVKLICSVETNSEVSVEIILVGIFENSEQDPELKEEFDKINTVSIMFPYLRAQLSLLTAQPNFPTIDLPVFNINELLRSKDDIVGTITK